MTAWRLNNNVSQDVRIPPFINIEELGVYAREKPGLKHSFKFKPMKITEQYIEWKNMVLKACEDQQNRIREAELLRDDFGKGLSMVAKEGKGHKALAELFVGMFPKQFAYCKQRRVV